MIECVFGWLHHNLVSDIGRGPVRSVLMSQFVDVEHVRLWLDDFVRNVGQAQQVIGKWAARKKSRSSIGSLESKRYDSAAAIEPIAAFYGDLLFVAEKELGAVLELCEMRPDIDVQLVAGDEAAMRAWQLLACVLAGVGGPSARPGVVAARDGACKLGVASSAAAFSALGCVAGFFIDEHDNVCFYVPSEAKLIRVDHMGTFWVPFGYLLGTF